VLTQPVIDSGGESVRDLNDLSKNTRVIAPLGDVLYPGTVVEPLADQPLDEGMIRIELTPRVKTVPPCDSITFIFCPLDRVTVGWF
jgi:hypothetical protein